MQRLVLLLFFGLLLWLILNLGIEHALVAGTLISALVWLPYRFLKGKSVTPPYLVENARSFLPVFLVVLLIRSLIAEPFRIPSGSMMPTLLVGDFILVNKFMYGLRLPVTKTKILDIESPERGDVIVFRWPQNERLDYIKRVIGVPGDKVRYVHKTVYINGQPTPITPIGRYQAVGSGQRAQGYLHGQEQLPNDVQHDVLVNPRAPDFNPSCTFMGYQAVTVPAGHYLVMGDNRDDSNDGRCWGFVPEQNLVGKAFLVWLNWDWQAPGFIDWQRLGQAIQ